MTLDATPDRLGPLVDATAAALAELAERDAVARLWAGDHTLWRDDPTEITDRLGWLTVVPEIQAGLDRLRAECAARAAEVDQVLLMGMGGSSLFPEVIRRTQLSGDGPRLDVVDTTDPAAVARVGDRCPPERTLHIAASKSGSTLETRSHLEWAWNRHPDPARFAVITDPGSELDALATERGFAAVWRNRPDIGGRYSALSYFGIVPALLCVPRLVEPLLSSASQMAERLRTAASANPAAQLGAVLAAGVRTGRDKVTLVVADDIRTFGLWLEQLLAESTGKDGTGVVPVVGETLGPPEVYGDDRVFVVVGDPDDVTDADDYPVTPLLDRLADAGHPVYGLGAAGPDTLGGQVLLWEAATAFCGALLGIQPFDQPDVAAAKEATAKVLDDGLPDEPTVPLAELIDQVKPGDYLAIQAFLDPVSQTALRDIEEAREVLRDRLKVATTVGLGPRFLHSTGQLHKGGPDTGVFVQVVGEAEGEAVAIPGRPYDFGTLERAQAAGDLLTLRQRGRRVGRVALADLMNPNLPNLPEAAR